MIEETLEHRVKRLKEELAALKQAKKVGLLLKSYSWDSGDNYNWQNRNYKITFGGGKFPVIAHFNDLGVITAFSPYEEGGNTVQIFNYQSIGVNRIIIVSTRPILSVVPI